MIVWPLKSVVISLVRIENSFRCWYGWWPAWSMDSRTGDPSYMSWVVRFTCFFVCALWILNFQYMFSWLLLDVCLGCKVPPCCPSTQKGGVSAGVQLIPRQQKVQKIWVSCLAYHACLRWHVFLQPCRRWDFCCHRTWIVQVRGWGGVGCGAVGWGGVGWANNVHVRLRNHVMLRWCNVLARLHIYAVLRWCNVLVRLHIYAVLRSCNVLARLHIYAVLR